MKLNAALAEALGLETTWLASAEGTAVWPGITCPRGPTRWRWPMPGISSAISCRSSAMGGRSCWAKSWAGMARGAICS